MLDIFEGIELSEDLKGKLSERVNSLKSEWQEAAKNDPDFHDKMKKQASGKAWDMAESRLKKQLGINGNDLKDLKYDEGEFGSRFNAILSYGISDLNQNKDKTVQEWQNKFIEANNKITDLEENVIPGIKESAQSEQQKMFIEHQAKNRAASLDLIIDHEHAHPILEKGLSGYVLKIENNEIVPYNQDGSSRVTINDKIASFNDLISNILSPLVRKSNGRGVTQDKKTIPSITGPELSQNTKMMAERLELAI